MTWHSSGENKQNKNFGTAKTGGGQRKTAREDYSSLQLPKQTCNIFP